MTLSRIGRVVCPACESKRIVPYCFAAVSPWVLELARNAAQSIVEICECLHCNTIFTSSTFPDVVLGALYRDYRGSEYQKIRQSWEPGYTIDLNSALNGDESWMQTRQSDILASLNKAGVNIEDIEVCVDFGGGHGGVMPNFPKKYVFEENKQVKDSDTVQVLTIWESVKELKPDLVMCCGVLEHVNYPVELIKLIQSSDAKYFYFEVPAGTPAKRVGLFSKPVFLKLIQKNKPMWRFIQKTERSIGRNRTRRYFPFRISEHLQFFSEKGLQALLENSGFKVLYIGTQDHNSGLADSKNVAFNQTIGAIVRF